MGGGPPKAAAVLRKLPASRRRRVGRRRRRRHGAPRRGAICVPGAGAPPDMTARVWWNCAVRRRAHDASGPESTKRLAEICPICFKLEQDVGHTMLVAHLHTLHVPFGGLRQCGGLSSGIS